MQGQVHFIIRGCTRGLYADIWIPPIYCDHADLSHTTHWCCRCLSVANVWTYASAFWHAPTDNADMVMFSKYNVVEDHQSLKEFLSGDLEHFIRSSWQYIQQLLTLCSLEIAIPIDMSPVWLKMLRKYKDKWDTGYIWTWFMPWGWAICRLFIISEEMMSCIYNKRTV